MLLASGTASAAELRGRIWNPKTNQAPAGATLHVTCPGFERSLGLADNGQYSVRSLPSNASCTVAVSIGDKRSSNVAVRTNAPVVRFNAEVRSLSNRILVLPR